MALRTYLFTVRLDENYIVNVFVDSGNSVENDLAIDPSTVYPVYSEGDLTNQWCIDETTTLMQFFYQTAPPYAYIAFVTNSPLCAYVPPICDIYLKTVTSTDETTFGANDGTITAFAVSSFTIVNYSISGAASQTNTTGIFIHLIPGNYSVVATDTNGCITAPVDVVIHSGLGRSHLKYVLQFNSVIGGNVCRLEINDQLHTFDETVYPLYLMGSAKPIVKKTTNSNEDKSATILPTSLAIEVIFDGTTFTVDEFALADERTWYCKYFINGQLDFQGWMLPDEIQDFYKDEKYYVQLIATDGLLSLKGIDYSDSSGIQEYGIFAWATLVKNCLDKLNYDYGLTTLISSLQYSSFRSDLWIVVATWADLFYDDSGLPQDTYSVLDTLLGGVGLSVHQDKGVFRLVSWNDCFYIQSPIKIGDWYNSIWQFNAGMTAINNGYSYPSPNIITVGYGMQLKPVNPDQSLNYDKAYNIIQSDIDFNYFTLLYANPSFDIGAISGNLPTEFATRGGLIPNTGLINTDAYVGDYSLKIGSSENTINQWVQVPDMTGFNVDQPNKQINISFYWKVPGFSIDTFAFVFSFVPVFIVGSDLWFLVIPPLRGLSYADYITGTHPHTNQPPGMQWQLADQFYSEGDIPTIKGTAIAANINQWNNFTILSPPLPAGGLGHLFIRFYGVKALPFDNSSWVATSNYYDSLFLTMPASTNNYYLIDQLEITLADASDPLNKQIGEKHKVTNATNFGKAEKKTVQQSLFTYPANKRIAGNVFIGTAYDTAIVANNWTFKLSTPVIIDRLPAVIIRQLAKQYQRPTYIFEGDVIFTSISYFSVFIINGYTDRIFMPYTIERDDRNGIAHIVLIEIDDTTPQNSYIYTGKYEKSARKVLS